MQNGTGQDHETSEGTEGKSYGPCWASRVGKQDNQVLVMPTENIQAPVFSESHT